MSAAAAVALLVVAAAPLPRVAILPNVVEGPHGAATARDVFDAAAEGFGDRLDADLPPYEEVVLSGATSLATEVARCGSDDRCLRRALQDAGMTYGLRVIVNFGLQPPLVTVTLVGANDDLRRAEFAEVPAGGDWRPTLGAAARRLADGQGFTPAGRLVVTPPGNGGRVTLVGDAGRRLGPTTFVVAPGLQRARWTRSDGAVAEGRIEVRPFETATLSLVAPIGPPAAAPAETGTSWLASPWLWIGVGVVAAGATTAALAAGGVFEGDPPPGCLCITTPGVPCGGC